uniref:Uncharacterized protein n=1 Tax=Anguilla anguilla TaxID=7936 RepID=A0A0E9U164_ANGAN
MLDWSYVGNCRLCKMDWA